MEDISKTLIAITRLSVLKKISIADSFYLFLDSITTGDYERFRRYGTKVEESDTYRKIICQINRDYKELIA